MIKFDNYIFLTICEKSYENFKKTKFMTYSAYCSNFKNCFLLQKFSKSEASDFNSIILYIKRIYDLSDEESFKYVKNFFILDKNIIFQENVRLTMHHYKNSYL
jgi:hypothetical protein